jgi:hypothetical protein
LSSNNTSFIATEQNFDKISNALSRLRGAALKLGQMLSIQDEELIPGVSLRKRKESNIIKKGTNSLAIGRFVVKIKKQCGLYAFFSSK